MHESTQRRLRRMGVILLGFAPLLLCLLLALLEFSSGYQNWRVAWWEDLLSQRLGVEVQLDRVVNHTPGTTELRGITLRHPETDELLGTANSVSLTKFDGKSYVHLDRGELEQEQLGNVWRIIHELYVCRPNNHGRPSVLTIDEIILRRSPGGLQPGVVQTDPTKLGSTKESLHNVTIRTYPQASELVIESSFRYGNSQQARYSDLRVARDHSPNSAKTHLYLYSETPLPCSLVHGLVAGSESLGAHAHFHGQIDAWLYGHRWSANLKNASIWNVNCEEALACVGLDSELLISGKAQLRLTSAELKSDRLVSAAGELTFVNGGKLSNYAIRAMPYLGITTSNFNQVLSVPFSKGHVRFDITQGKLRLTGDAQHGVLFSEAGNAIALRAEQQPIPLSRLPALLPRAAGGQPTSGAIWLNQWLPIGVPTSRVASLPNQP